MGYAFPASIGASIYNPNRRVVAFTGDGSMQMNIQDLQTMKYHDLDIKLIILNNFGYGIIKQFQDLYFDGRHHATGEGYSQPDFGKIVAGYGIDYWPTSAKIIQVDLNPSRIGLTKKVTVGIVGDAAKVASGITAKLSAGAGDAGRKERKAMIAQTKSAWAQELTSMTDEQDDPGTDWNVRARAAKPEWMSPRMAWRAIQAALPTDAIISSDIGNNCAIGNAYPSFTESRKYLAPGLFGTPTHLLHHILLWSFQRIRTLT